MKNFKSLFGLITPVLLLCLIITSIKTNVPIITVERVPTAEAVLSPEQQQAITWEMSNLRNQSADFLERQIEEGDDAWIHLHHDSTLDRPSKAEAEVPVVVIPSADYQVEPQDRPNLGSTVIYQSNKQLTGGGHISLAQRINFAKATRNYPQLARLIRQQQILREEHEMADEDREEHQLTLEMQKVHQLQRKLQRAKGFSVPRRKAPSSKKEEKISIWSDKLEPLWDGVDTHVTAADLKDKSLMQRGFQYHLWQHWDEENQRDRKNENLKDEIKAVHAVLSSRSGSRYSRAEDRATQAEIGELTNTTDSLWWEYDPSLHYRDLGPDGRRFSLRRSLVSRQRRRGPAHAPPPPQTAARPELPRRRCKGCGEHCSSSVFCRFRTADAYIGYMERPEVANSKEAEPGLPFTPADWAAAKRGADFENTFPDTNDLRTLDWLGAESSDPDNKYDALKDSMSAAGAEVPTPDDYEYFPKAQGYYTQYDAATMNPGSRKMYV